MAINIKFDLTNNPESPTIILANRSGNKLGELDAKDIELSDKFNDASEITFTLNKYVDGKLTNLWDKVVDFKLVHCKEWDMWFEIRVELDEATHSTKTVFCTQLGQAELSQIMIYNMTINQEGDANWGEDEKEYKKTILFNPKDPSTSLLNRLLKDKAPHYSIIHVDDTIAGIQRMFDFDGTSIYDAFMEIAEEIGCLFVFHSNSDENGKIQRTISVYDLQQNCLNPDCRHRGEFTDTCPKCGSTNIKYGYGEDTTIFVTADELATEGIQLTTDVDSVKNCFKLEAGDDLMTATIRNCNPNGTDYIWYFSEDMKSDMSEELVNRIESYDAEYEKHYNDYESVIDVSKYNALVEKYKVYDEDLEPIDTTIKGYSSLMNAYYNTVDFALYLESALMPSVEIAETNAEEQAKLLTSDSLSPVAVNVKEIKSISPATANSAVLSMAKVIVKSTFKVEIDSSSISDDKTTWTGNFVVTNYSDEEDVYTTGDITVTINNDTESFIRQKIDKALNKDNTDDLSISGLFAKDYDEFCTELKKYALNPLTTFYDSCESCLSILTEQGVGNKETWADTTEGADSNLYEKLYLPYYNKSQAIASEIAIRENEILIAEDIQNHIIECRDDIQSKLNFEDYIGDDLWDEFCSYRREDKYSNDNYISDGLSNTELFNKAKEFIEVAEGEIYKSAELQHSISSTLNNLLAIEKFKPLVKYFSVGNWIRVRVDEEVYKLRLLEYSISYGNFDTIPVDFSDVTKIKTGITDVQEVLSQASSMATSYSSVQKQASQGEQSKGTIDQWLSDGLNSAQVRIQSNDTEDVVMDRNGLLCRSYNEITDTYEPEQFRLTHNMMAYTSDNWETVSAALGKHDYIYFDDNNVKQNGVDYGLSAKFVTAGYVVGSQMISGNIFSENYSETDKSGSHLDLTDGTFSFAGGKLVYNGDDLIVDGKVTVATEGTIACWNVNKDSIWKGSESFGNANGMYFGTEGLSLGDSFKVTNAGVATMTGANITGTINAKEGRIGGFTIDNNSLVATEDYDGSHILINYNNGQGSGNYDLTGTIRIGNIYQNGAQYIFQAKGISDLEGINGGGTRAVSISLEEGFIIRDTTYGDSYIRADNELTIDTSWVNVHGKITAGGSIVSGYRVYLPNGAALRGALNGYDSGESDGSNCIAYVNNDDRVVLGHAANTKATEVRSPYSVLLKCGGTTVDESRYTLQWAKLNLGTEAEPKNRGVLRPTYDTENGETTAYSNLGSDQHRWKNLYITSDAVITSDRNLKKNINSVSEQYIRLFDCLNPVTYQMIDGDRIHIGFISQEVEDAMNQVGLTAEDFGGFCKDIKTKYDNETEQDIPVLDENGNYEYSYSLRYGEFIALNTAKIKQLEQLVLELQNEIKELKS